MDYDQITTTLRTLLTGAGDFPTIKRRTDGTLDVTANDGTAFRITVGAHGPSMLRGYSIPPVFTKTLGEPE